MFVKQDAIKTLRIYPKVPASAYQRGYLRLLYNMAQELQEKNALMLSVGVKKGNEPLLLSRGGQPYRGVLEVRVLPDRYLLILHLTDIELKQLTDDGSI